MLTLANSEPTLPIPIGCRFRLSTAAADAAAATAAAADRCCRELRVAYVPLWRLRWLVRLPSAVVLQVEVFAVEVLFTTVGTDGGLKITLEKPTASHKQRY